MASTTSTTTSTTVSQVMGPTLHLNGAATINKYSNGSTLTSFLNTATVHVPGTLNVTGTHNVPIPTTASHAANKAYVDSNMTFETNRAQSCESALSS